MLNLSGNVRLTKNPEVSYTINGTCIATLNVASRYDAKESTFLILKAIGKIAEVIGNNLVKGQEIEIVAKHKGQMVDMPDGTRKYRQEFIIDKIEFGRKPKDNNNFANNNNNEGGYIDLNNNNNPNNVDDIPFTN